jgi:hypothetical protein
VAIVLSCECGRKLQIKEEFAGQEGQCPSCGRTMVIPSGDDPIDAPLPATTAVEVTEAPPIPNRAPAPEPSASPEASRPVILLNHGGGPLGPDCEFFADPPEEIGPVLSAHSTLTTVKRPWSPGVRLIVIGVSGLFGLAAGSAIVLFAMPREPFWEVFWPTLAALLVVIVATLVTRFSHTCSYVGRDGIAKFKCSGTRDRVKQSELFLFRDATYLRTGQTRHYHNGVYIGTQYFFTWSDSNGRKVHTIGGRYKSAAGTPASTDPFHYGRSAELAFSMFLVPYAQREMDTHGSVAFPLKGRNMLRIGPGRLIILQSNEPEQWDANDIAAVSVDSGVVKIMRKDAKEGWFSSSGVVKFNFADLTNSRLFLHLMNNMLGIRVI